MYLIVIVLGCNTNIIAPPNMEMSHKLDFLKIGKKCQKMAINHTITAIMVWILVNIYNNRGWVMDEIVQIDK